MREWGVSRAAMAGQRVLYLSYDGMTDPLGQSQVLPYLAGLAGRGHAISLISFEKAARSRQEREAVRALCARAGIDWHPQEYHKRPPILSGLYDLIVMARAAVRLHRRRRFDWVHCRSDLPALVGLAMKRHHGVKFLFDMRGFWADERVDGGLWDQGNPLFRALYRLFKRKEAEFLREADHAVSLTEAGRQVLEKQGAESPISVIPCCVDFAAFRPAGTAARGEARDRLGIAADARVAAYLGSIGTWYMLDEMLDCFRVQLERDPGAVFLVISRDDPAPIMAAAAAKGIQPKSLLIRGASRGEVPLFIAAADYGLFFIRPSFSKVASCPTKLGELMAMEIPVLTNGGVGDIAGIVAESGAGVIVEDFTAAAYCRALDCLEGLPSARDDWRATARKWFDLKAGVERYDAIYRSAATASNKTTTRGACEASE
jgi:glycosyltransferase involved in cell wall biosynthesis